MKLEGMNARTPARTHGTGGESAGLLLVNQPASRRQSHPAARGPPANGDRGIHALNGVSWPNRQTPISTRTGACRRAIVIASLAARFGLERLLGGVGSSS